MSRRKNFNIPGHAHELTFSCYQRIPLLEADRTCVWLADAIESARLKESFDLWAYVFMPEHVHLLIRPHGDYDIALIRKAIKSPVGSRAIGWLEEYDPAWLSNLTRQRGPRTERLFWQSGGGYDRNITEPKTLAAVVEYIHMNPVRRGLVERAADWKWSSAAAFEEQGDAPLPIDPIPPDWWNSA